MEWSAKRFSAPLSMVLMEFLVSAECGAPNWLPAVWGSTWGAPAKVVKALKRLVNWPSERKSLTCRQLSS